MGYKGDFPEVVRGTESRHIALREGVVYWVNFIVSATDGTIRLRNGSDEHAEILITQMVYAGIPGMTRFNPPLPYRNGLYLECVANVQDWTIAFDHLEE